MEKSVEMGRNRTGIDMSPIDSKAMIKAVEEYPPAHANGLSLVALERDYIEHAEKIGSVPLPGTFKGALKSLVKKAQDRSPEVLMNKLGERLAFERSGVRIYQGLINKCEVATQSGQMPQVISLDRLREFCDQEAEHFHLLKECIESLGADPTAQTPDADLSGVASMGLMKVIMDPRTSVDQSLEAMLSIELTDNAAWDLLIKLAQDMGLDEMAQRFEHALQQEDVHLHEIREWYEQMVRRQGAEVLKSPRH